MSSNKKNSKKLIQVILFFTFVFIAIASGTTLDVSLLHRGLSSLTVLILANALTGAVAAALYFQRAEHQAQKLADADENLKILREMNHEVRSILGVVAFYGEQTRNDYVIQAFESGFKRMESIMREVLKRSSVIKLQDPPSKFPLRATVQVGRGVNYRPKQMTNYAKDLARMN